MPFTIGNYLQKNVPSSAGLLRAVSYITVAGLLIGGVILGFGSSITPGHSTDANIVHPFVAKETSANGVSGTATGAQVISGVTSDSYIFTKSGGTIIGPFAAPNVLCTNSGCTIRPKGGKVGTIALNVAATMSGTGLQVTGTGASPMIFADIVHGFLGFGTKTPTQTYTFQGTASGSGLQLGGSTATTKKILTATSTLDFGNLASLGCEVLTVAVPGAALSDVVSLGVPNASNVTNGQFTAWVDSANSVTIKFCTVISGDPASGSFRVMVTNLTP